MFIFVYQLIEAFIVVFFVGVLDKWYWKTVPLIMVPAGDYLMLKLNILVLQDGWNQYYSIAVSLASLLVFIIIEKYTLLPVKR
ncbi:hypothetical protein [Desulfosporosinus orientis]|uniref:hypothetical protein n=1 Tax=Desulfosporosinus orientis TaxID=1563 RepID=UPI0002E97579|nr:hypothetical protein [Desulfosporosinus orientis]